MLGLAADVIGATGDPQLAAWAAERLSPRRDSYLLVASGAGNLGPCLGVMAAIAPSTRERRLLLEQAVKNADRDDLSLWQVGVPAPPRRHLRGGRRRAPTMDRRGRRAGGHALAAGARRPAPLTSADAKSYPARQPRARRQVGAQPPRAAAT